MLLNVKKRKEFLQELGYSKGLVVPNYVGNSLDVININTVRLISTDSTGDELLYNNILPGGIKFNKQFKVSVKTYGSYRLMPCALYGIY